MEQGASYRTTMIQPQIATTGAAPVAEHGPIIPLPYEVNYAPVVTSGGISSIECSVDGRDSSCTQFFLKVPAGAGPVSLTRLPLYMPPGIGEENDGVNARPLKGNAGAVMTYNRGEVEYQDKEGNFNGFALAEMAHWANPSAAPVQVGLNATNPERPFTYIEPTTSGPKGTVGGVVERVNYNVQNIDDGTYEQLGFVHSTESGRTTVLDKNLTVAGKTMDSSMVTHLPADGKTVVGVITSSNWNNGGEQARGAVWAVDEKGQISDKPSPMPVPSNYSDGIPAAAADLKIQTPGVNWATSATVEIGRSPFGVSRTSVVVEDFWTEGTRGGVRAGSLERVRYTATDPTGAAVAFSRYMPAIPGVSPEGTIQVPGRQVLTLEEGIIVANTRPVDQKTGVTTYTPTGHPNGAYYIDDRGETAALHVIGSDKSIKLVDVLKAVRPDLPDGNVQSIEWAEVENGGKRIMFAVRYNEGYGVDYQLVPVNRDAFVAKAKEMGGVR